MTFCQSVNSLGHFIDFCIFLFFFFTGLRSILKVLMAASRQCLDGPEYFVFVALEEISQSPNLVSPPAHHECKIHSSLLRCVCQSRLTVSSNAADN